jgi:hypothetical protein
VPGTDTAISASLNGWGFDYLGRKVFVSSRVVAGPPPLAVIVQELSLQRPILVTFNPGVAIGHAVVITSVRRVGRCITSIVCRDPWPSPENRAERGRVEYHGANVSSFLPSIQSHWLVSVCFS